MLGFTLMGRNCVHKDFQNQHQILSMIVGYVLVNVKPPIFYCYYIFFFVEITESKFYLLVSR